MPGTYPVSRGCREGAAAVGGGGPPLRISIRLRMYISELGKYASMPMGSRLKIKYKHMIRLPPMLQYQNDIGMTLSPCRSEASHWTKKRIEKKTFPMKPR